MIGPKGFDERLTCIVPFGHVAGWNRHSKGRTSHAAFLSPFPRLPSVSNTYRKAHRMHLAEGTLKIDEQFIGSDLEVLFNSDPMRDELVVRSSQFRDKVVS